MTEFSAFILDDDEFILRALQRTLKRLVPHWQLHFFQTSLDLLHHLQSVPSLHLVISDRMMPDCLGEEVLAAVQQQRPSAIRCLLTADTSAEIVIQDCNFIHHFLAKPFTEADLIRVFHSVEHLESLPLSPALRQHLGHLSHLPILPALFFDLQSLCRSSDVTAVQLAEKASQDPVLAGRLLQLANSPFMGYSRQTLELDEAVMRLGFDLILSIAIMLYAQHQLQSALDEQSHQQLISQCWQRAGLCQHIAHSAGFMKELQDKAYMLGLLSGLGELVLAVSPELKHQSTQPELTASITAYLLTLWGFDATLRHALMQQSTQLNLLQEADLLQFCLRSANACTARQKAGLQADIAMFDIPDHTPERLRKTLLTLWQQAEQMQLPDLGAF